MSDRDTRLMSILRIGRDASLRGNGASVRDALKRVSYVGYRPTFRASDLVPLVAADPALIEDWLAYSEDKRTAGGWYARAYERFLLRPLARFPLDGEVYEALDDTPIHLLTHWRAPFTGAGNGNLPKGTRVRVKVPDWIREPISVSADPVDGPRIERLLVPEGDRQNAKYAGFSLSISTADLNRLFRLVQANLPDV